MTLQRLSVPIFLAAVGSAFAVAQSAEELRLTVGKSIVIDYPSDIRQIATSTDSVDASPVTTREILVQGKNLGSATMIVWSKTGQRTFYNVTVDMNLDPLRRALRDTFPNENIHVDAARDTLTLSGQVSNKDVIDKAVAIASGFSKATISNLTVPVAPAERQILLRVKFAELDRSQEVQFGVNLLGVAGQTLTGANTGQFSAPSLSGTATVSPGASGSSGSSSSSQGTFSISQALNIFAFDPRLNLGALVKALQTKSILQVLTEPNLVTTSGKEASFLVGGEFPVPILQGGSNSGAVTVQFREFGIRLKFTPTLTPIHTIKMHLNQEVSTLDAANGVTVNGFNIPALSTRRAETDVELGEGQSFVVAGLVDNRDTENFSKIPVLGSLPIFGSLFKSKDIEKSRTDLIVIVTPEVTMPLGPNDPKPNIYFPSDFLVRLDPKDVPPPPPTTSKKK